MVAKNRAGIGERDKQEGGGSEGEKEAENPLES